MLLRGNLTEIEGAPGLAFETWDPCNRSQMETPLSPVSLQAFLSQLATASRLLRCATSRRAIVGFARLFRPTYAQANVGHPSCSRLFLAS
jgi:hypothetical protein